MDCPIWLCAPPTPVEPLAPRGKRFGSMRFRTGSLILAHPLLVIQESPPLFAPSCQVAAMSETVQLATSV
ncbi:MAG: hypothetical protein KatS3mg114_0173 [Planctomycetaceae bacterium]|nr:MAG: hypothetical protein KatS3mg114_0173 [Planctomycetaceae bacterium]